jgi:hypothetical protein
MFLIMFPKNKTISLMVGAQLKNQRKDLGMNSISTPRGNKPY